MNAIIPIVDIDNWYYWYRQNSNWVTIMIIKQRDAQVKTIGYECILFAFDNKHALLRHAILLLWLWFQNYFTELKTPVYAYRLVRSQPQKYDCQVDSEFEIRQSVWILKCVFDCKWCPTFFKDFEPFPEYLWRSMVMLVTICLKCSASSTVSILGWRWQI